MRDGRSFLPRVMGETCHMTYTVPPEGILPIPTLYLSDPTQPSYEIYTHLFIVLSSRNSKGTTKEQQKNNKKTHKNKTHKNPHLNL